MIMLDLAGLNWWLIGAAVLTATVAGAVWYSPLLFGSQWASAMKIGKKEKVDTSAMPYLMSVVSHLIVAVVVAELVYAFGATTLAEGVRVGAIFGASLVALQIVHTSFKGNKAVALINGGYDFIVVLLMAGILAAWR